jgi:hypothetical protein
MLELSPNCTKPVELQMLYGFVGLSVATLRQSEDKHREVTNSFQESGMDEQKWQQLSRKLSAAG